MIEQIKHIFGDRNCIEKLRSGNYFVYELKNNDKVFLSYLTENPKADFRVNNQNSNAYFLSVDGCITFPEGKKKCDFATWNDTNFYFVEIKQINKIKSKKNNKKKAIQQLFDTITVFQENKINYYNRTLSAIISWGFKFSGEVITTTMQSREIEFKQKFNVNLLEGNQLTL